MEQEYELDQSVLNNMKERYSQNLSIFIDEFVEWAKLLEIDMKNTPKAKSRITKYIRTVVGEYDDIYNPSSRLIVGINTNSKEQFNDKVGCQLIAHKKGVVYFQSNLWGHSYGYLSKKDDSKLEDGWFFGNGFEFVTLIPENVGTFEHKLKPYNKSKDTIYEGFDIKAEFHWDVALDCRTMNDDVILIPSYRWENILVPWLKKWL